MTFSRGGRVATLRFVIVKAKRRGHPCQTCPRLIYGYADSAWVRVRP
jgi:hypothetical protein